MKNKILKKIVTIAVIVGMLSSLTACGEKPEQVVTKAEPDPVVEDAGAMDETDAAEETEKTDEIKYISYVIEDEYEYDYENVGDEYVDYAQCDYDRIKVTSDEFPTLKRAVNEYSKNNENSILQEYASIGEYARSDYEEGYFYGPYEISESLVVQRADNIIFSILKNYSGYSGGAHGYYGVYGINFDSQTGEEMNWQELFTNTDKLTDIICQKLDDIYGADSFFDDYVDYVGYYVAGTDGEMDYELPFSVDSRGVTFYFNPYAIAAYASGMQEVTISYEEYPDLLKAEYFEKTYKKYALPFYYDVQVDANSDGEMDLITVSPEEWTEYDEFESMNVMVNDEEITLDAYGFSYDAYVVKNDEKTYVYVSCSCENDWRINHVVDISTGTPSYVGTFNGYIRSMTTPAYFEVSQYGHILSTVGFGATYRVGADGMPDKIDKDYYINTNFELESVVPLTGKLVNGGEATEDEVTFPAGTSFRYVATDGETYVDLEANGNVCRFEVNLDWPQQINGMDAEDCFVELLYAG